MRRMVVALCLSTSLAWAAPSSSLAEEEKPPGAAEPKPFEEVVKDARKIEGLFTIYRTDEKVLLEILPEQFGRTYVLALTIESAIGERGFFASMMGGAPAVALEKRGKNVLLLLENTRFTAEDGTPIHRATERSFSDSIAGVASIVSLPHPERKSELVDLGAVLLADVPMLGHALESTFRIPYRFDAKASDFGEVVGHPRNVEIQVRAHYAVDSPPVPPLPPPQGPPPPAPPPPPRNLPDVRSMQMGLHYSLAELPPPGYRPRLADDRVGHFPTVHDDFTRDRSYTPTRRFINRWHLEKADPGAERSRPKQPIVFWLENTIPEEYRPAIREGILLWNDAFERIGFEDAIEVRQQPDDADWTAGDVRYSTVRWFISTDWVFAIGPSNADPWTGEIYDADIGFAESFTRMIRRGYVEEVEPVSATPALLASPWGQRARGAACDMAAGAVNEASFGFNMLLARGMDPDGPEAEAYVRQYLVSVAAHEVGHTLGLRHNFQASTIHPLDSLQDRELTTREGLTGSVMDYTPVNISEDPSEQGEYSQTSLGPYDYWAIEYAYKPIPAESPEDELEELGQIAARGSSDPRLAYATDEDAGLGSGAWDMDPEANRWDLGSDPLAYYARTVRLSREIFDKMEATLEQPGEGFQVLRRSFGGALFREGRSLFLAAKYIGGVHNPRVHVGDPGGRRPFEPVSRARQQEALDLLRENLFSASAFQFSPELLNKLASERWVDWRNIEAQRRRYDYPVHEQVLTLQTRVLDRLYDPVVLGRILDSEVKTEDPFTIGALFEGVQGAVWEETGSPPSPLAINSYRRSLQRAHLKKLIDMVLTGGGVPEDARTMARAGLRSLAEQLQAPLEADVEGTSEETRAHLEESLSRIEEALSARAQRATF